MTAHLSQSATMLEVMFPVTVLPSHPHITPHLTPTHCVSGSGSGGTTAPCWAPEVVSETLGGDAGARRGLILLSRRTRTRSLMTITATLMIISFVSLQRLCGN